MRQCKPRVVWAIVVGVTLAVLWLPGAATADLTGNYAKFAQCPYDNPTVAKCIYTTIDDGEVIIGSRRVPVINRVALQGGYTEAATNGFSSFVAASDGETVSKASQPVPGGLLGIIAPDGATPLVKAVVAMIFESGLNRVDATLELARPASEIKLSENNLGGEIGTALKLPVKVHLENPLLGESCYVGSVESPILWELTSATTKPPAPNKPIKGTAGKIEILEGGLIVETQGTKLVDNSWAVPAASGCGGPLSFLINPIVSREMNLPSPAGRNAAVLTSSLHLVSATVEKEKAEESP